MPEVGAGGEMVCPVKRCVLMPETSEGGCVV